MTSSNPVKVSVCMITYNHENFIAQAIESVLMQDTVFSYELVIGEDCSTDHTREIVVEYQKKYPDRIHLLLHEKNLGFTGKKNLAETLNACKGQYIALLEGDDYWVSPQKLQKQVIYLDNNINCSACFHNVNVIYEDDKHESHPFHNVELKSFFSLEDIVSDFFIPTCSTMFRAKLFQEFPDWYYSLFCGDWSLHILNAEHGNYGYINEIMGVYRVHAGGVLSGRNNKLEAYKDTIYAMEVVNRYFNYKYNKTIKDNISLYHFKLADVLIIENNRSKAIYHIKQSLMNSFINRKISNIMFLKVIMQLTFPNYYKIAKKLFNNLKSNDVTKNL